MSKYICSLIIIGIVSITITGFGQIITFQKTYGGSNTDMIYEIQQTSDNGYFIVGFTENFGASGQDAYIIKTNMYGDTLWTRILGSSYTDYAVSGKQTIDGNYIITGGTGSNGGGNDDVFLLKMDSIGNTSWMKTYGGSQYEIGLFVEQTLDSGFIILGVSNSYGYGSTDIYLIKTNQSGDTL